MLDDRNSNGGLQDKILWQVQNLLIQTVGHGMRNEKQKIKTLKRGELKF